MVVGGVVVLTQHSLSQPLWSYSLHSIVGETGADGRYAVRTSFPQSVFGHPGRAFSWFSSEMPRFWFHSLVALVFVNQGRNVEVTPLRMRLLNVEHEPWTSLGSNALSMQSLMRVFFARSNYLL